MGFVGAAGGKNGVADGKTTVSADAMTQALTFFQKVKPYSSEIGNGDQANVDLVTTNEVAYYIMGPWANPGLADITMTAKKMKSYPTCLVILHILPEGNRLLSSQAFHIVGDWLCYAEACGGVKLEHDHSEHEGCATPESLK